MRPDSDEYFLMIAKLVSTRGTCVRRKVGCVLVDKYNHIMATGYNGVPKGAHHCDGGMRCEGADSASGTGLDDCMAIHAEQNALLQCRNMNEIEVCYCTVSPCITCTKLLLNTSCKRIVFIEPYPHNKAKILWTKDKRYWDSFSASYRDTLFLRPFIKVLDELFPPGYSKIN